MSHRVSSDYLPIFWVGRVPVYLTTCLIGLYVAAAVGWTFATGSSRGAELVFSSAAVLNKFQVWRLVSYPFVQTLNIWFAIEMLCFFWFGREVERYLGRQAFATLYGILIGSMSMGLVLIGPWMPSFLAGSSLVHLGVFVAFAMLYPSVELLFRVQARWFAIGAVILAAVTDDRSGLVALACMLVALFFYLYSLGVSQAVAGMEVCKQAFWRKKTARRPTRNVRERGATRAASERVDEILEKISRDGLSSLTQQERDELQQARKELLAQERRK